MVVVVLITPEGQSQHGNVVDAADLDHGPDHARRRNRRHH
jgi:hypothetical protein